MAHKYPETRRGSTLVEFAFVAVPLVFSLISIIEVARASWIYHTLCYNVNTAARMASLRGKNCSSNGNCLSLGALARQIQGVGIDPSAVTLTLTPAADPPCAKLSSCLDKTSAWPPSAKNDLGAAIEISATYNFTSVLGNYSFSANSRQQIQF